MSETTMHYECSADGCTTDTPKPCGSRCHARLVQPSTEPITEDTPTPPDAEAVAREEELRYSRLLAEALVKHLGNDTHAMAEILHHANMRVEYAREAVERRVDAQWARAVNDAKAEAATAREAVAFVAALDAGEIYRVISRGEGVSLWAKDESSHTAVTALAAFRAALVEEIVKMVRSEGFIESLADVVDDVNPRPKHSGDIADARIYAEWVAKRIDTIRGVAAGEEG